jgi:hypothetical protein
MLHAVKELEKANTTGVSKEYATTKNPQFTV